MDTRLAIVLRYAIGLRRGEMFRPVQTNFDKYPVARIDEARRETHVQIIGTDNPPAGVGEPGVPPMTPAICSTIFATTGIRIRELPIKRQSA